MAEITLVIHIEIDSCVRAVWKDADRFAQAKTARATAGSEAHEEPEDERSVPL